MNPKRRSLPTLLALSAALLPAVLFQSCKKSSDSVIARAGSVKITQTDFTKELASSPPTYLSYLSTTEGKKQFLDILLKEKILLNSAEKSGITQRKEFQKEMRDYEQRMKEQMAEYRKGLLMRAYLRDLKDNELKVSESEVQTYYDQNAETYKRPILVNASHILCLTQEDAENALQRIHKGENFGQVAREVSKDPTAAHGGLIGDVRRGDLADLPEFESALFELRPNQVSGVVKTKIGYHIIRMNKETRLAALKFDDAVPQIRKVLEKRKFDAWVEKAKKDQNVWVDEKALASIPVPSEPEQPNPAAVPGAPQ